MTTTELIRILKDYEFGGITGKSREVSFSINDDELYMDEPEITVVGTGDGIGGAEICLGLKGKVWIPASDRLPDDAGFYVVTKKQKS